MRINNDSSNYAGFCPRLKRTFASTKALQTPSSVVAMGRVPSPVGLEVQPANSNRYSVEAIEITRASRNSDVRKKLCL